MEKPTNRKSQVSATSRPEPRLSTRGSRRSRSSKGSRGSKWSTTAVLVEKPQQVDAEETTNYRESITNLFFESFLETIIVERTSKQEVVPSSISVFGEIDALSSSRDSVSQSAYTLETLNVISGTNVSKVASKAQKSSIIIAKEPSVQKTSHFNQSTQSLHESTSTKENDSHISCASNCLCKWKIVFGNGNTYEGTTNGTLMHGNGVFNWTDGSVYKGEFKDGYPWGQGKLVLPDLSTYDGEFLMGFFHGRGTFNVKYTPILYSGEWKCTQRNGKGWLLYDTNNWYEGDWAKNKKHGYGYRHYSNGSTYKGHWLHDKINGEGCMFWSNNDNYVGEWSNGFQNGYGEYTWNLIAHNKFVFPNYNWYKGNWVNGYRNGLGIMSFGHESGARLAGTWEMNRKHGPGLMICGNGMILQRNPLFNDDKPSPFQKPLSDPDFAYSKSLINSKTDIQTYTTISEQIKSKENLDHVNEESLLSITRSGTSIKAKQYIKLLEKNTGNAPPLKIPIHNIIHEVDLSYFINTVQRGQVVPKDSDISALEIYQMVFNSKFPNELPSTINYMSSNNEIYTHVVETSASLESIPNVNEVKNLIIIYLPQLRSIYKTYASFCAKEGELTFEPVLVRLFLWQLYRDIGVTDKNGISIVEIDEILVKNTKSCLETVHNPWEPIYFWQFLQALVGVASLLYSNANKLDYIPTSGFMYHMFKSFLEYRLIPNYGKFEGNCLTHLKDLVPISSVYRLYKEVGEPHTVEEFLKNTCLKEGRGVPCYKIINSEHINEFAVQTGTNIVVLNNQVKFEETGRTVLKYEEDRRYENQTLYTFSQLERKQIIKCLAKICTQIISDSGRILLHYRISFIEFYEAILLLAYEKVENERTTLVNDSKGIIEPRDSKAFNRETSKLSQHTTKKKKLKK